MIVSPQEYNGLLHQIKDPNMFTKMLRIPENEKIYNIDLSKRTIEAPEFLSVETDIDAEVIWFKVDRFFDTIDLYSGTCWIIYTNAAGNSYFYAAPMQVTCGQYGNDYLLIPWLISKEVADKSGTVRFSFQFFKLSEDYQRFLYILNTQTTTSKILLNPNADIENTAEEDIENAVNSDSILGQLKQLTDAYTQLSNNYELYWIEV